VKRLSDVLFGRPLSTQEAERQQIGPFVGVGVLGLDALASAAYGPEAALTVLLPLGRAGVAAITPILCLVVAVLLIVCFSYRQTIAAYPSGGGSYTVAKENFGVSFGLVAGAGLCLDYVLNVAVAISSGVGALVSVFPVLLPQTLPLCLGILGFLTVINLRGIRDTGFAFVFPTWLFVASLLGCMAVGVVKTIFFAGSPEPVVVPPRLAFPPETAGAWVLLRAFASGCTAMTGVEAVSNAVPIFREPATHQARRTLSFIVIILASMLLGLAVLCPAYGIGATEPGKPGYESVLSQVVATVAGRGAVYLVTMGATMIVLGLSANTSFADFPRVCRMLAGDKFLPDVFAHQGRRLVFSHGIVTLAALAAALLIGFRGITDRLIPLFAIGAFLAFTMSQAGMVAHWRRVGGPRARRSQLINGVGATVTAGTLLIVLISKFAEGAWVALLLIPATFVMLRRVNRYEKRFGAETALERPLDVGVGLPPIMVVPMRRWDRIAEKGLRLALQLSADVHAVQVLTDLEKENLKDRWHSIVEEPARRAGRKAPELHVLPSDYRELIDPLFRYICALRDANPSREIAVVIPEVVEHRWYHYVFRHHTAAALTALLLWKAGPRVLVIHAPWYLTD
jgi:amino acid transporter